MVHPCPRVPALPRAALRAAICAVLACAALPAAAQPPVGPEDRATLERVALARARSDILASIRALRLRENVSVGDRAARDVLTDRALRQWARGLPRFALRQYSLAVVEVDARLSPEAARDGLLQIFRENAPTDASTGEEVELRRASEDWPVLWGTGTATAADLAQGNRPAGWEDVTLEGIELAKRAAAADARAALLETAGRVKLTNAYRLSEFLRASDEIRAAVESDLEKTGKLTLDLAGDQIAVAELRISINDLIRILSDVHARLYRGDEIRPADFREMALLSSTAELAAAGLAGPPGRTILKNRFAELELDAPDWVNRTISAVGRFDAPDGDRTTPDERVELARIDGISRLREQVEALRVQGDVSVAAMLGYKPELKDDVVLFLSGARTAGRPQRRADGGVDVTVELRLRRLWEILRRGMTRVEVDPPTASAPATAPSAAPATRPRE